MTPARSVRTLVPVALSSLALALAVGCGGSSSSGTGSTLKVKPGDPCAAANQKAPAADGCNTCTCTEGSWACTEMACLADGGSPPPPVCTPGTTKPAGDTCNTCTCNASGDEWLCTRTACTVCNPGQTTNDGCNACSCVDGQWACTDRACPPPACIDGETKKMDCNTCTCSGGVWACTKIGCPPPVCTNGDTKYDGCNMCSCMNGAWGCTTKACPPAEDAGSAPKGCGGWLGDTCSDAEYCAYEDGQLCGAADASSFCKPRPFACDAVYDPVCGCDQKTYGNACEAAMAGTGVHTKGPCVTGTF
ncbi:MAG TPA: hypothetical protein VHE30_18045 [Polyangiaceae bacterium]|nr:hypothetical protein [Polyangiaceae bacterium]